MKNLKIYAILTFLFLRCTSVSAQSMLELYFGGNKDSLTIEATKLIHTPEPKFKHIDQQAKPNPSLIADMGFEQVYNCLLYTSLTPGKLHGPFSSQENMI